MPRIEVNVCFRVLIPESGLADFGQKPPLPQKDIRTASALSKLVYALDELSGNVLSVLQSGTQLGHHGPARFTYLHPTI